MVRIFRKICACSLALVLTIGIVGCGKEEKNNEPVEQEVVENDLATERVKGWFVAAAEAYAKESLGIDECKLYAKVYGVKDGIDSENAMLYASADMSLYIEAGKVQEDAVSEFSDGFARKLAADGASGDINFAVYCVPSSVYQQIEEGNHTQVEEKADSMDGYSKYGFEYSGIGDSIHSEGNGEWTGSIDDTETTVPEGGTEADGNQTTGSGLTIED